MELDSYTGQFCIIYKDEIQLRKIFEIRHEIQNLVLQKFIEQAFVKELIPLMFEMQAKLNQSDEIAVKNYMYLWRLLYFVLIDRANRLTMFVKK